ncbi:MAG: threonine--tRNA ligase [Oscillospiraceae bacterium]|jgi:threonyl-tRNA synthetase|nr:threonine--tRNA ligase [Oscillospiraceae bacterium]
MGQIKLTLKTGETREVEAGTTAFQATLAIGQGLAKAACVCKLNGRICDLSTPITEDAAFEVLTFDDDAGRRAFRHTASHVLAHAVKRLYPAAKLAIGPAIDTGFYYDFDVDEPFTAEQLAAIETEMKKIIKEDLLLEQFALPADEASALLQSMGEPYKEELCAEHADKGEAISFYRQGDFVDLCAGPHLRKTGQIKAFALTSATGAYWRGDAKKKMLQRIYGTAFPKKEQLEAYLTSLEEAKKRDHNKLGRELEIFTTTDVIGQGLPILLPKGTTIMRILQRFVEDEEERRGYLQTKTPLFAKRELYQISGHWDHYRDDMFVLGDPSVFEDPNAEVFALRPMTCPFQFQAYLNRPRSYRDLPLRYNETSTLFRNEASGEMHGLIRVRQFTISEGHLACRPDQLEDEFAECLDLARYCLKAVGLEEDVRYRFSLWDENNREKYIGDPAQWETTQDAMRKLLDRLGVDYQEEAGEAAFYGPKLDFQVKNVFGKEDTLVTIQIDFQLAERFGMTYTDADGQKKFPFVIHRTSIGCYERLLALLIEKYAGAFPVWFAPEQVRVLPISEKYMNTSRAVLQSLRGAGIRAALDERGEKIGYKIREGQMQKIPYMLIIGEKEAETGTVAVRKRGGGDIGAMPLADLIARVLDEDKTRVLD